MKARAGGGNRRGTGRPSTGGKPFRLIYEAEWNDIPCGDYPLTPEKWVAECIRPLAGTQVDALFYNLCSSDGYCCGLRSGQILMDNFPKVGDAWVWRYRENTKELLRRGANPPALAVRHGRRLGIKVVPVVRMNDPHDQYFRYEVSAFKLKNPQLLIGAKTGYMDWEKGFGGHPDGRSIESFTWGLFDYAHAEVREHKFAAIREFVTRWKNDGVSLDFERDPWLFAEEGKPENAEILTEFVRRVRKLLDGVARRRRSEQHLHVRVLPDIDACVRRGMDVRAWVREGLVDAVTPGCGYMTVSLDLGPWRELVKGRRCWVYAANNHWKSPEETRAWARVMYDAGADGLYLFNWGHLLYGFDRNSRPTSERLGTVTYDELHPCYYEALRQIGSPATLAFRDATYNLESVPHDLLPGASGALQRRYRAIDAIELPIRLSVGRHTIAVPFAEDIAGALDHGFTPSITLRLRIENYTAPDVLDVSINGVKLDRRGRSAQAVFIMNNDTWLTQALGTGVLRRGKNRLTIAVRKLNRQMSAVPVLKNVEIVVRY
ncbi:MAG: hypothetical protein V2A58_09675 [Planctomycetota bacterium]